MKHHTAALVVLPRVVGVSGLVLVSLSGYLVQATLAGDLPHLGDARRVDLLGYRRVLVV